MTEQKTPLMTQYEQIKSHWPNAILLFRIGDFYETFAADAEFVAQHLDIVLTSRNISKTQRVVMAGIPYHAVEGYIAKLIAAGQHVAICEQVSDEPIEGLLPREVIRVEAPKGGTAWKKTEADPHGIPEALRGDRHMGVSNEHYTCSDCQRDLGGRLDRLAKGSAAPDVHILEDGRVKCEKCWLKNPELSTEAVGPMQPCVLEPTQVKQRPTWDELRRKVGLDV